MAWIGWGIFAAVMWLGVLGSLIAIISPDTMQGTGFPTGGTAWFNVIVGGFIAAGASAKAREERDKPNT